MNWPMVPIGEVARVVSGATPKSDEPSFWGEEVPWVTPKDLSDLDSQLISDTPRKLSRLGLQSCSAERLPTGSVLFSSRAPIGHVAINTQPMATNQGFKSFVPGHRLHASFLYWWLRCNRSFVEGLGNGATFKEVSKAVVERISIPLPPLTEQKRIAAILDQVDTLQRKRRRVIQLASRVAQAVFTEMFSDTPDQRYPVVNLAELVDTTDSINYGVLQPGSDVEGGVPLVRVGDLLEPGLNMANLKRISPDIEAAYKRSRLRGSEILIACVGSIGTIALAEEVMRGFNIARAVARVPIDSEKADRLFVSTQLRSSRVQRYFNAETRTVSQPTLNIKQIRETRIALPAMEQQLAFRRRLEKVLRVEEAMSDAVLELNSLFDSLQHRAFRGEL